MFSETTHAQEKLHHMTETDVSGIGAVILRSVVTTNDDDGFFLINVMQCTSAAVPTIILVLLGSSKALFIVIANYFCSFVCFVPFNINFSLAIFAFSSSFSAALIFKNKNRSCDC